MNAAPRCVTVESPARLHLGFVDLSGDLGRKFGSLGLALEGVATTVTATPAESLEVCGLEAERTRRVATDIIAALAPGRQVALEVSHAIPAHAGLGSGTQLALAVASAIAEAHGIDRTIRELAALTGRGARSGIGIGVFESGGFVVDGGRAANTVVPPVLGRFDFPDAWRIVLVRDVGHQGLSGSAESAAFRDAAPMRPALAEKLCRLTLMGVFPALVEQDFTTFSRSIAEIQTIIGDYFGPWQGGAYTSPDVARSIERLREVHGLIGAGQTSWGPTGFAFAATAADAAAAVDDLGRQFADYPNLAFSVHAARNHGATIKHVVAPAYVARATVRS